NLLASTDKGTVYCFGSSNVERPAEIALPIEPNLSSDQNALAAAKRILQETPVDVGYCLDFGCEDGTLAVEIAKNTQFQVIAIDDDVANVALARKRAASSGL